MRNYRRGTSFFLLARSSFGVKESSIFPSSWSNFFTFFLITKSTKAFSTPSFFVFAPDNNLTSCNSSSFIGWDMYVYKERTKRKPSSMDLIKCPAKRPHLSVRNVRSTVITCDTFATESLGRPESDAAINTLPGASATRRFDVRTTAMIVRIRLRLKASDWTITTGRLKPGSEAVGSGNSAHQISPRSITTPRGVTTLPEVGRGWGITKNLLLHKRRRDVLLDGGFDALTGTQ